MISDTESDEQWGQVMLLIDGNDKFFKQNEVRADSNDHVHTIPSTSPYFQGQLSAIEDG
jgi:hypothetical protein